MCLVTISLSLSLSLLSSCSPGGPEYNLITSNPHTIQQESDEANEFHSGSSRFIDQGRLCFLKILRLTYLATGILSIYQRSERLRD